MPEGYYPTPKELLDKITGNVKWNMIRTVLEPSAGKGDIADYVKEKCYGDLNIDCIEIDEGLRQILKGKGIRVVHDDFLTFHTFKHYNLIIMNPPFKYGARHLLHALSLQKDDYGLICILNAETLKNPYTNERKELILKLENLNAKIEYMCNEFQTAERPTGVEIAVIKITVPKKEQQSDIFNRLKEKNYPKSPSYKETNLVLNDYIMAAIQQYNIETEAGIRLILEHEAMIPYIQRSLKIESYSVPILEMTVCGEKPSINNYVKEVRRKYWTALFNNPKFTGEMTSNLANDYRKKVSELIEYDFSMYNIKTLQLEMSQRLVRGIEECIMDLFDKLSYEHAYSDECKHNVHYYNGWKTNKAWYINKKVILPNMNAFSGLGGKFEPNYHIIEQLEDMEKALTYLNGGISDGFDLHKCLKHAKENRQTQKIRLKYFYVTFYKKGTCHIEFTDFDLLKKLNIFGGRQRRWLPPAYGKKNYDEMLSEERKIIDEFEGKEEYERIMINLDYFLYNPNTSVKRLEVNNAV